MGQVLGTYSTCKVYCMSFGYATCPKMWDYFVTVASGPSPYEAAMP